jgi:hypothetical protein
LATGSATSAADWQPFTVIYESQLMPLRFELLVWARCEEDAGITGQVAGHMAIARLARLGLAIMGEQVGQESEGWMN